MLSDLGSTQVLVPGPPAGLCMRPPIPDAIVPLAVPVAVLAVKEKVKILLRSNGLRARQILLGLVLAVQGDAVLGADIFWLVIVRAEIGRWLHSWDGLPAIEHPGFVRSHPLR